MRAAFPLGALAAWLAAAALGAAPAPAAARSQGGDFVVLAETLRDGLDMAETRLEDESAPRLRRATIAVEIVVSSEAEAGFTLFSIGPKGEIEHESNASIEIVFERITGGESAPTSGAAAELADLIVNAVAAAQASREVFTALPLSSINLSLAFAVRRAVGAGIEIEFGPIFSVAAGGKGGRASTNTITLELADD